jgi:hypothetical protein
VSPACSNHGKYLSVAVTKKRGVPRKKDVHNYTNAPHITLHAVISVQYFWGDVVRSANSLLHFLTVTVYLTQPKIDNLEKR